VAKLHFRGRQIGEAEENGLTRTPFQLSIKKNPDNEPDHTHLYKPFRKRPTITENGIFMKRRKRLNVSAILCQDPQSLRLHILYGVHV
jgi:hypothetical protein